MREWIRQEPKPNVSKVARVPTVRRPDDMPPKRCGNCVNWKQPDEPDGFGTCRVVGTLTRRIPRGPEKGTCIEVRRLIRMDCFDYDLMSTREWFAACAFYELGFPSDPDQKGNREHPVQGRLFDLVAEHRER